MDDDGIIKENDSTTMVVLETTTITEEEPEVSKPAAPAAAAPAPTQPKRLSTLYLPTKSSLTKQRHTDGDDLKSTLSGSQKFKSTTSSSASSSSARRAATAAAPRTPRGLGKSHKQQQQQQLHGGIKRGLTLTVPVTPKFLTDARMRMAHKERPLTTEERELQAVDEARKAEQQRMLKIKRVFHRVQVKVQGGGAGTHAVVKSKKELTVPVTPVSYLSRRKGHKVCSLAAAAGSSLGRGSGGADVKALSTTVDFTNRKPTQPEPFVFATDARLKAPHPAAAAAEAAPTVAEAAERFMRDPRSHGAPPHVPGRRTEAHPPKLMTDLRAKTDFRPKPMSTEEKEAQEFAALQSKAFKAKPVDRRIFESMGELGVPKVPARAATEPEPFDLRIDKRATVRPVTDPADAEPSVQPFKARPVPDATHHAPPPPPQPEPKQLTVPRSPKLSGGPHAAAAPAHRQLPHHTVQEQERLKAKEAAAALPSPPKTGLTEPKPFDLRVDSRGAVYQQQLAAQQRATQAQEEAARAVKAAPAPAHILARPSFTPAPSDKELTEFDEFHLRSVARHQYEAQAQEQEARRRAEEEEKAAHFHARPVPKTLYEKDFEPVFEERAPLVPVDVSFESDQRAAKRKEFDDAMAAKVAQLEEQKELAARRKLEDENRRIKELRSKPVEEGGMMFKAQPIMRHDPYPSKATKAPPLTTPKSPAFSVSKRAAAAAAAAAATTAAGTAHELKAALEQM